MKNKTPINLDMEIQPVDILNDLELLEREIVKVLSHKFSDRISICLHDNLCEELSHKLEKELKNKMLNSLWRNFLLG